MALDFPANPSDGEVFGSYVWSTSKGVWQSREESAAPAVVSPVPPTTPNTGDIWVDSSDGISYVYYDDGSSGQWIEMISSGVVSLASKANLDGGNTFTGTQNFGTPISVPSGGTGAGSFTAGTYIKGNGSSALITQSGIPAEDITSGILPIARGGTGVATGSGLVPIVPTAVAVGSGSFTIGSNGLVSVTSASNVQLRGIFTSTYRNYRIVYRGILTGNGGFSIQLVSGTSTINSTANYAFNAAWFGSRGNNSTSATTATGWGGIFGHNRQSWSGDIFAPNLASNRTHMIGFGHASADSDGAGEMHIDGGTFKADNQFTGLHFTPTGGFSFQSATFQIFGYRE
jgi:hypothetical protein